MYCTEAVPSKAMCYIFLWQLMCVQRPLFFWECISFIVAVSNASNHFVCSLWKHVIHAVSVLGVLAGAKEQFWGIQAQTALCIYVGQNIHCRFWGIYRIQFHIWEPRSSAADIRNERRVIEKQTWNQNVGWRGEVRGDQGEQGKHYKIFFFRNTS